MPKSRTISEIKEFLNEEIERAKRSLVDSKKYGGHSCYGAGVDHGEITAFGKVMGFLNFQED
jgi:hypothetical protein